MQRADELLAAARRQVKQPRRHAAPRGVYRAPHVDGDVLRLVFVLEIVIVIVHTLAATAKRGLCGAAAAASATTGAVAVATTAAAALDDVHAPKIEGLQANLLLLLVLLLLFGHRSAQTYLDLMTSPCAQLQWPTHVPTHVSTHLTEQHELPLPLRLRTQRAVRLARRRARA